MPQGLALRLVLLPWNHHLREVAWEGAGRQWGSAEGLSSLSHIPTPEAVSHTLPRGGGDEGFSRLQPSPLSLPQGLLFPLPSWGPEGGAGTPSGIAWTNPYTAVHLHSHQLEVRAGRNPLGTRFGNQRRHPGDMGPGRCGCLPGRPQRRLWLKQSLCKSTAWRVGNCDCPVVM